MHERCPPNPEGLLAVRIAFDQGVELRHRRATESTHRGETEAVLAEAIPAEQLIRSVTGKEDRRIRPRLPDQMIGGQRDAVPDRLGQAAERRLEIPGDRLIRDVDQSGTPG